MILVTYDFVPPGYVATPTSGKVCIDVGNHFGPGVLDHHHGGTPEQCASEMVLTHPEWVLSQKVAQSQSNHSNMDDTLEIVTHLYPDMDAIGGCWLATRLLGGETFGPAERLIAGYINTVDRGHTTLDGPNAVSLYALMAVYLGAIYRVDGEANERSLTGLQAGMAMLEGVRMAVGAAESFDTKTLDSAEWLLRLPEARRTAELLRHDWVTYVEDVASGHMFTCTLPYANASGSAAVPALWVSKPKSILFKNWARGDTYQSGAQGFVLTIVELGPSRTIISVPPESGLYLRGLGDKLEAAEVDERRRLGQARVGAPRRGFEGPDPWYHGRGPLHNYSIIDAPSEGTVLSRMEIRRCVAEYGQCDLSGLVA